MGSSPIYGLHEDGAQEVESGYVSGSSSQVDLPEIYFTKPHLAFLNRQLQHLEPQGMTHAPHSYDSNTDMINCRDITMVYYLSTLPLPGDRVWPYWPHKSRHAVKHESSKTPNGRPSFLRHSPRIPGNA